MKRVTCFLLLALCCLGYPVFSFENELSAVLRASPIVRELVLQQAKTEQAARLQGFAAWPSLYLAAPQLYTLTLQPEPAHSAAATLGIRQALPFGLGLDVFWQHQLVYTPLLADKSNEQNVGFFQPVSAGLQLSVPIVFSPYLNSSARIAVSMRQLADTDQKLGISSLVDRFLQSWFELYRMYEQNGLSRAKLNSLEARTVLIRKQVDSGLLALHQIWESERQYRSAEIQLIQSENEFTGKKNQFFTEFGTEYPQHPQLPDEAFTFSSYGILPILEIRQQKQALQKRLMDIRVRSQASASAVALLFSAAFKGSVANEPAGVKESFSANFKSLEDWKPVISLGFSISTTDIGAALVRRQDARLDLDLLETGHTAQDAADHIRYQQLLSLREQYKNYLASQQQSLDEVALYYADMVLQAERGAVDLLELDSVAMLLAELQTEAALIRAHLLETVLRCWLLGGSE